MRKTIVLYNSKTGYTKKYAEWIAGELASEISDQRNFHKELDNIIFGGSLYATGIIGIKKFIKSLNEVEGKKIIVFATGLSLKSEEVRKEVMKANFKSAYEKQIEFFYFRGGFNFQNLPAHDKVLMQLKNKMMEGKAKKETKLTSG